MTLAIITTAIFGTLATLALLYAMHLRGENDALRAKILGYIEIINDFMLEDE